MIRKILKKILKNYNSIKYARLIGVKVGDNCRLIGNIKYGTEPYLIEIGNHVSITAGSFICHEGAHWVLKGIDKKYSNTFGYGKIIINDNVYIGQGCTILRGVTIGENTIVGACGLVTKSLEPNSVYAGVPAKKICSLDEWKEKFLADMPEYNIENYKKNKKDEILRIINKFSKR